MLLLRRTLQRSIIRRRTIHRHSFEERARDFISSGDIVWSARLTCGSAVDRPTSKVTRRRPATWKTENARAAARVDRLVGRLLGCGSIENLSDAEPHSIRRLTTRRQLFVVVFRDRSAEQPTTARQTFKRSVVIVLCVRLHGPNKPQFAGRQSARVVICGSLFRHRTGSDVHWSDFTLDGPCCEEDERQN